MTPNKLPQEIHDTIKTEAKLYDQSYYTHLSQHSHKAPSDHYQAGATAWAPWKVKHDALTAILQEFVSKHEAGLLPDRFVYEKAIKILNDGK